MRLFSCTISDAALKAKVKAEGQDVFETDNPKQYNEFKQLVMSNVIKPWDDCKDIKIAVGETVNRYSLDESLVGWVRPNKVIDVERLTNEVTRLSEENHSFRLINETLKAKAAPQHDDEIPHGDMPIILEDILAGLKEDELSLPGFI